MIAFCILAWDKATGISAEEKREIGIRVALGAEPQPEEGAERQGAVREVHEAHEGRGLREDVRRCLSVLNAREREVVILYFGMGMRSGFLLASAIPFSVLFTASFVQDGHGMLPMLSYSVKDSLLIKLLNYVFGVFVGGGLYFFVWG